MGQKVNPNGYRFGINRNWISRWIAKDNKQTAIWLVQDEKIRDLFVSKFPKALIDRVEIERKNLTIDIFVYSAQPGVINGLIDEKKAELTLSINKIVGRKVKVNIVIISVENPNLSARIIAREIADAIENRVSFRIAQKQAVRKVMRNGAYGIKTSVSGRLGGTDIARTEGYLEGNVPLSTLRADIDYVLELARTTYGVIGVKVWINRGNRFGGIYAKTEYKKVATRFSNDDNSARKNKKRTPNAQNKTVQESAYKSHKNQTLNKTISKENQPEPKALEVKQENRGE